MDILDTRTTRFAASVGVHYHLAYIFTSRVPEKISIKGKNGKIKEIDGDTIVYSILDDVYDLHAHLAFDPKKKADFFNNYAMSDNIKKISFERFVVREIFSSCLSKGRYVQISIDDLSDKEIDALYEWIALG